jgi:mRNA-degrading endonuclease RelE of RelBE toxin-antitoxin system
MLNIEYSERFLKDLKKLRNNKIYNQIKELCFEKLPAFENLSSIKNLKKIQGHTNYYRIRIGNHRIGIKIEGNTIFIMRVLHRREIYKYFP